MKKRRVRQLEDVPKLIENLASHDLETQKNAAISLRKLSHENDDNKRAIKNAGGIPALASVLPKTGKMRLRDDVSGTLWNLSSCDELKRPILEQAADTLVKQVIIPGSGFRYQSRAYSPNVFKNATGVLRNVSAATETAPKMLRESPNLVDTLVHFLHLALSRGEADTTTVENVVCLLRNLSYKCQELEDSDYDLLAQSNKESKSAQRVFCCCRPRVSNEKESYNEEEEQWSSQPTGMLLLWHIETAKLYLRILADDSCSTVTLEAATGAIQNLCACGWQPAAQIRATVRKERGLPTFIEMLRLPDDNTLNCTAAYAIRNLIIDRRNKELIGRYCKYVMDSLVDKLPHEGDTRTSDSTLIAVLAVIYLIVRDESYFGMTLHEKGGTERLIYLSTKHSNAQVVKYASQILRAMWRQHKDLRKVLKMTGHRKVDFFVSDGSADGEMIALTRPISTLGSERPANQGEEGD